MEGSILDTLNKSALKLLALQSVQQLCSTIVEEAKRLVGAEYGSLYLMEKGKLNRVYLSSARFEQVKTRKKGFTQQAFQTRNVLVLHSKQIEKPHPELIQLGVRSMVMIPLSHKTETIGVLCMQSLTEDYFTNKQLHILKLFGSMATLAITKTRLHEETQRALEIRDRFISLASHELRTPLTSINGYIQLLYSKLANKNSIEARWVAELYSESRRLTNLVKELLDVNRIKQGQLEFHLSEVDMRDVVKRAIQAQENPQVEKEIVFEEKSGDKQYMVIGDFDKLQEMVSALLSNAIKFSKPRTKIVITLKRTARNISMKIKDYGKGIPSQDLEGIFQGFYKTKNSHHKEGMGVGLLLAKHVVTYHKGKIAISSKENQGTSVDVELPRIKA